jgi:hypothetical protein
VNGITEGLGSKACGRFRSQHVRVGRLRRASLARRARAAARRAQPANPGANTPARNTSAPGLPLNAPHPETLAQTRPHATLPRQASDATPATRPWREHVPMQHLRARPPTQRPQPANPGANTFPCNTSAPGLRRTTRNRRTLAQTRRHATPLRHGSGETSATGELRAPSEPAHVVMPFTCAASGGSERNRPIAGAAARSATARSVSVPQVSARNTSAPGLPRKRPHAPNPGANTSAYNNLRARAPARRTRPGQPQQPRASPLGPLTR